MRRREDLKVYEERYRRIRHGNGFECFYCGEPASTMDHVPPMSRIGDYEALVGEDARYWKVAACEECNTLLGASLQVDIFARIDALKGRLRHRYQRDLRVPDWSNAELRPLGRWLRSRVQAGLRKAEWVEARIDYSAGLQWLLDLSERSMGRAWDDEVVR